MSAGNPANDIILVRDEMHRTMMARGSKRLAGAIQQHKSGWVPRASNDDLMWLVETPVGTLVRQAVTQPEPVAINRDPCASCGVRADRHAEGGCKAYRRGRAA